MAPGRVVGPPNGLGTNAYIPPHIFRQAKRIWVSRETIMQGSLVAWGEPYVELARTICLPSLGMGGVRIATNKPKEFQGHRIMPCAGPEANRKHSFVTAQHLNVLRLGEPTVLLCADFVFGAGALEALTRLAGTYKLVVVPAIRLHMEAMQSCLWNAPQPLENRELCGLALQNIHPNAKVLFGGTSRCPYQSYRWDGKDLKARCYHMHPILMTGLPGSGTIDNGVDKFKPEETYVVQDSDELAVFELSPKRYDWGSKGDGASKEDTEAWVQAKTNSMHRWFFEQECTIHG